MLRQCVVILLMLIGNGFAVEKIKVLIIDGVNNHNWKETTKDTKAILLKTGRFSVDVNTSPSKKSTTRDWEKWLPEFSKYQVVVSNYNDGGRSLWASKTKEAFEKYISEGGGFVSVHAADNSSSDWPAYNKMIAIGGWGGRRAGVSGYLLRKYEGQWQKDSPKKGGSGGHGPQTEFVVTHDLPDHPIVKGLPIEWLHAKDELYHSLRGPAEDVTVLGSAVSKKSHLAEPMMMLIKYGKGTVFHTPMGHFNKLSTRCVGFQTIFARGTEYVATGKVTIGKPVSFPTKSKSVVLAPSNLKWP